MRPACPTKSAVAKRHGDKTATFVPPATIAQTRMLKLWKEKVYGQDRITMLTTGSVSKNRDGPAFPARLAKYLPFKSSAGWIRLTST